MAAKKSLYYSTIGFIAVVTFSAPRPLSVAYGDSSPQGASQGGMVLVRDGQGKGWCGVCRIALDN
jgi:hypothetical protein